jgi:hypothetical protein
MADYNFSLCFAEVFIIPLSFPLHLSVSSVETGDRQSQSRVQMCRAFIVEFAIRICDSVSLRYREKMQKFLTSYLAASNADAHRLDSISKTSK